jgi:hypothetical protein
MAYQQRYKELTQLVAYICDMGTKLLSSIDFARGHNSERAIFAEYSVSLGTVVSDLRSDDLSDNIPIGGIDC